jgi:hypothetical protein
MKFRILFLGLILAVATAVPAFSQTAPTPAPTQPKTDAMPIYIKVFVEKENTIGQTISKDVLSILKSAPDLNVVESSSDPNDAPGPEIRLFFFPVKSIETGETATTVMMIVLFHDKGSDPIYIGASGGVISESKTAGAGQFLVDQLSEAVSNYLQDKADQAAAQKLRSKS